MDSTDIRVTAGNRELQELPRCTGVYRFLDAEDKVLYIGKSVDIRNRVKTHLNGGETDRQLRMLAAIARIDCRPTAGEVGALLLENAAIKREIPLYNRRQRSIRRMWSFSLAEAAEGFLKPKLASYSLELPDIEATYGSYLSRHHARQALEKLSRDAVLCQRALGIERGKGACFQHQIGRCHGACLGKESPKIHNGRLRAALEQHRLSAWPITAPVLLKETGTNPLAPAEEWHLLHNWIYLGSFGSPEEVRKGIEQDAVMFDRDTYRILRSVLNRANAKLFDLETLTPVQWPASERCA